MKTKQYDDKILHLLSDQKTFKNLKDLTPTLQTKMNAILLSLKKQDKLSQNLCNLLCCSNGITSQLYGLPKIHNPGVPLRPIVSFYSSPTYQLSKYLCHLLSPLYSVRVEWSYPDMRITLPFYMLSAWNLHQSIQLANVLFIYKIWLSSAPRK